MIMFFPLIAFKQYVSSHPGNKINFILDCCDRIKNELDDLILKINSFCFVRWYVLWFNFNPTLQF